jgi:DNA-binding LacI/PurR family transcriptional regulator
MKNTEKTPDHGVDAFTVSTKDIALRLGISPSTVSRALHGKLVSPKTIREVRKVAKELGYRPNIGARMMASGKTGMYGLLVPSTINPYFGTAVEIFQSAAFKQGYYINLGVYQEDLTEFKKYIDLMVKERRVDGLIIFPMHDPRILQVLASVAREKVPIILMAHTLIDGIHWVSVDFEKAGRMMAMHLLDLGHRRIGLIQGTYGHGQIETNVFREPRVDGFEHAMLERNITWPIQELRMHAEISMRGGYEAAQRLLKLQPRPTAIFSICDLQALGVLKAVMDAGLRVPQDISVAGFDNTPFADFMDLTTGDMHLDRMAKHALDFLAKATQKDHNGETHHETVIPDIILRSSTGPVPHHAKV